MTPELSVIIPACARPDGLRRCLDRLRPGAQTLDPSLYEVIVTDDGTGCRQETLESEFPWARFTLGPKRGPAANRNHGASMARGNWLVFIDDDCVPDRQWLSAFFAEARGDQFDLMEGRVVATGWTGHPLDEAVQNLGGGAFWSCNLAVRRDFFVRSGGFDEEFPAPAFEDMEFAARLKKMRARTCFVHGAVVEHPTRRLTLWKLWQRRMLGRWHVLYLRKTTGISRGRLAWLIFANHLRLQRTHARQFQWEHWRRGVFLPFWELATFPIYFPLVIFWDWQFRRCQSRRQFETAAHRSETAACY